MSNKTFPKENQKKLNETIRDLKAELRNRDKEIKFLRDEINNITKPARTRKVHIELEPGSEAWKKDFIRRFKKEVLGEKV
jgi:hypothetical protein